jgi:hypothetical protein
VIGANTKDRHFNVGAGRSAYPMLSLGTCWLGALPLELSLPQVLQTKRSCEIQASPQSDDIKVIHVSADMCYHVCLPRLDWRGGGEILLRNTNKFKNADFKSH